APVHNTPDYATSSFKTLAPRLYEMARMGPADVDVLQSYENFTGGVLMSIVEHGFCTPAEVNDFFVLDNLLAPDGQLPLNTSGGNLAECYMHGLGLNLEAVRQIRRTSTAQVPRAEVSMVISGPMVTPVSSCILGSEATL
ncbi:MAG: acetyl-CoA acetyltransferase, partial [Gammaproteobacteria bacterium]